MSFDTALRFLLPKIYPITDRSLSGLTHAEQVRRLIDAGARLIQIREKQLPSGAFFEDAAAAVELGRRSGVTILINDRVDAAMLLGADGVHLGQADLPPAKARELLGPAAIIGFSTHDPAQITAAALLPINYVAFGPIFPTSTKSDLEPLSGLEGLTAARRLAAEMPLVAIGGIWHQNILSVLKSGADSAAVISAVARNGEISPNFARLANLVSAMG